MLLWPRAFLLTSAWLLACGQIENTPVPDLPAPDAICSGDDCTCPLGTRLTNEGSGVCEYCPFGTVNADPAATSCQRSQIVSGNYHTCLLTADGRVRCWGESDRGQLGYGNTQTIGDDESPRDAGDVQVGGRVTQIAAGEAHTCVLLENGDVRCWGLGYAGRLGLGDEADIGDDELPSDRSVVDLGAPALQIAAGGTHSCALLEGGRIRCWGGNEYGQLGNGDSENVGDDEPPRLGLDVDLGGVATRVSLGPRNGCALLETGHARCWGIMDFDYQSPDDSEAIRSPAEAGDLALPGRVEQISLGESVACAVLEGGRLRCWGQDTYGKLGYAEAAPLEVQDAPDVPVGGAVVDVQTSVNHTCAILSAGNVRCWGGVILGYPESWNNQANKTPEELGDLDIGGVVTALSAGVPHTCALLGTGAVRCWGFGAFEDEEGIRNGGWLGYGDTDDVGDDETPAAAGDVPVL